MQETIERPTVDVAPERFVLCWVGLHHPALCPDKIAEWLTKSAEWSGRTMRVHPLAIDGWNPTCTGCKDRFMTLNAKIFVRRLG